MECDLKDMFAAINYKLSISDDLFSNCIYSWDVCRQTDRTRCLFVLVDKW